LPFSLPSIQTELSKKYGLTVDEVTKACQSLYEKKMQTYVGTDCRYLPESMHAESLTVLKGLNTKYSAFVGKADPGIKYACWDDSKVSGEGGAAHHAIIPTGQTGPIGSEAERIVYDAVCRRYLSQFHPEHKYLSLSVVGLFGQDEFKTTATVTLSQGWKVVEGSPEDGDAPEPSDKDRESSKVSSKNKSE
ncbi:DNA topoisomerase III, partial [mine drainage metagenome]